MKVDFYKPKNEILKEHIAGYYFVLEDRISAPISYLTFPNNYCILSIYQNTEEVFSDNQYVIRSSNNKNIVAGLFSRYSKPIEIIYENLVNEITIYFNPIKINHFIDNPKIFEEAQISDFIPFPDFEEKMELIFNLPSRDDQVELLEDYLISRYVKKDLSIIEQILSDIDGGLRLEFIAEKYNFTRQHINKIFSKNVGKTPSEYRKVQRFRNTLLNQKISSNLTDLSNDNLYFDQSHFIRHFKELTDKRPSDFFKKVEIDKENIWLYL
nr:helix-turn-helix domain-containing protein [uncultured Chryseobacterium sp.]